MADRAMRMPLNKLTIWSSKLARSVFCFSSIGHLCRANIRATSGAIIPGSNPVLAESPRAQMSVELSQNVRCEISHLGWYVELLPTN